jgi:chemotaxis protein methyltransferase CheR
MAFTFFFRDYDTLAQAVELVIPSAMGRSRIRVWDAGCAMGQEPYTLAILLAESMGQFAFRNLQINATDYDEPLLKILTDGIYPAVELQRIPRELFDKYFEPVGNEGNYRVVDTIKNCVKASHHNLLSFKPIQDGFSLVICKNVLLHFQQHERIEVYKMFHRAMEPGALLATEHTQKLPPEVSSLFEQVVPNVQLFRKIGA